LRFRRSCSNQNALPDRGSVRKCLGCQKLVDDHQAPFRGIVRVCEGASGEKRHAHGFEITRKHELKISGLKLTRVGERLLGSPTNRAESPGKGQRKGPSRGRDSSK